MQHDSTICQVYIYNDVTKTKFGSKLINLYQMTTAKCLSIISVGLGFKQDYLPNREAPSSIKIYVKGR